MTLRLPHPLLLACLALAPAQAPAQSPSCEGTLSGAVKGTFSCAAKLVTDGAGNVSFVLEPLDRIAGVRAFQPGSFDLAGTPAARTYTLDDLGKGAASVTAKGGARYTATGGKGRRGEVSLTFTWVERERVAGSFTTSGTYRARLVAGPGRKGEVVVEARF